MTSYYARHGRLSPETLAAYARSNNNNNQINNNIQDRLTFYMYYLRDVVPDQVTVKFVPEDEYPTTRREIQLQTYTGRIFMSGIVSMERMSNPFKRAASDEAYSKFVDGYFVKDDAKWRFFTGNNRLRVYGGNGGDWDLKWDFGPIPDVAEVAAYLQSEYDSLRSL